jgi:Flp pilus assembly protein TadB
VDKRHTENQQTNNCGQTPHRKPTDKQLWTNATQKTNRQTTVDKRHTENQQTNNCGKTTHRKPTEKQLWTNATQKTNRQTTVDKRHTENQQSWFSVWRFSTVVCLLVFCVAFFHSCLSVGFLCDVFTQLFLCWFSV